jgi:prolyl-tRNA synthetase
MDKTPELGITVKKQQDFSSWYQQILTKGKFIDYYDVSGCYILLPNSYSIWENITKYLDEQFKSRGVKNAYFPLFVTKKNLEREASHIDGFQAEVAWVTKSGGKDLHEPIAIRPTSETIIYSQLPNMIRSYHDLPLKLNQWCNVVRWEFKDPTPFIRSREFLWNEGHSCFATQQEAQEEVLDIITLYKQTYRTQLCLPVIMGKKTNSEKFAGADDTYTVETFVPDSGKAIQAATAHCLGQNFSRMFDIEYYNDQKSKSHVWQTSWGFTTRSLGIMFMVHGDDMGAVVPSNLADIQVIVIPIFKKDTEDTVKHYVSRIKSRLEVKFRTFIDYREYSPGWKFNYSERMGIPIRLEIGPKDVEKNTVVLVTRHNLKKKTIAYDSNFNETIKQELEAMNTELFNSAQEKLDKSIARPNTWEEFTEAIENKKICLALWCGDAGCEEKIKVETGAKSLCMPIEKEYQILINELSCCVKCGAPTKISCLFGRSY